MGLGLYTECECRGCRLILGDLGLPERQEESKRFGQGGNTNAKGILGGEGGEGFSRGALSTRQWLSQRDEREAGTLGS